jgi:hypothetical protein
MCLRRRLLVGHGAGAGGDQSPAAYKRGCVGLNSMLRDDRPCSDFATTCYDTSLSIQTRPLLPLRFRSTRVHATQASVCWRAQSTVDSLFFIDVPTNPGPRSFCAWALRRCHWPTPQPIVQLLKPYSNLGPPIFRPPKVHEPVPNISRSRISRPQRVHL